MSQFKSCSISVTLAAFDRNFPSQSEPLLLQPFSGLIFLVVRVPCTTSRDIRALLSQVSCTLFLSLPLNRSSDYFDVWGPPYFVIQHYSQIRVIGEFTSSRISLQNTCSSFGGFLLVVKYMILHFEGLNSIFHF